MQTKENKMGVMPVRRLLITMSLPMVISMLVQALYNVVDGTPLPKDARCEVKNVDGAVLIVSAVPVPAAAQPAEQLH